MTIRLGVNIDHIATLRQARKSRYPDPFDSLVVLQKCRVDQVTIHLREDRRHIRDDDLTRIAEAKILPVNLEMAVTEAMLAIALKSKPETCTFVPEKREEITTEGGLDCVRGAKRIGQAADKLQRKGMRVSLFIDPDEDQVRMAAKLGADGIEIHTGEYCNLLEAFFARRGHYRFDSDSKIGLALNRIRSAAVLGKSLGLAVFAGHGLHVGNLSPVVKIAEIEEYNIGHAIIARAVFVGLEKAIKEVQKVLR